MATDLGEGKLWIQPSYGPREGWISTSYFCPRHTTWVAPLRPNQVTGPVIISEKNCH